ncbi:MAG: TetR/AcrR family transcriptional regulator [Anaerolineae bacterium]|nr:TetR/AcrR family transcriptional regulator [Anaerolineae bacterium]
MPYPAQISHEVVLEKALALLESEGIEQLSLHRIAAELGVKTPSLYRYFSSKGELLKAVNTVTAERLITAMQTTADATDSIEHALNMIRAYRDFARAHPAAYTLAFGALPENMRPDPAYTETLVLPLQAAMAKISGAGSALSMLRGAWALVHGFVTLEISQNFRRGGSVDDAFAASVAAYLRGWAET